MAIYPIKMLKDESGQPFVPLTHVSAVQGEEYTTTILYAIRQTAGHYKITNSDLTNSVLSGKMIAVRFDDVSDATEPSYLQINSETEYAIYKSDGINYLKMDGFGSSILYLGLISGKWVMISVGVDESSIGGHSITDKNNTVMTTRSVLNFYNFQVSDQPGIGATRIANPNYVSQEYTGTNITVTSNTWTKLQNTAVYPTETGVYKLIVYIEMNNLSEVGKEIGIRLVQTDSTEKEDWYFQFKRCKHTFEVIGNITNTSTDLVPEIYVDPFTSTDVNTITKYSFRYERLNEI